MSTSSGSGTLLGSPARGTSRSHSVWGCREGGGKEREKEKGRREAPLNIPYCQPWLFTASPYLLVSTGVVWVLGLALLYAQMNSTLVSGKEWACPLQALKTMTKEHF